MSRTFTYTMPELTTPMSIKNFLKKKGFSTRSMIVLKQQEGSVLLNDTPVFMTHMMQAGDVLTLTLREENSSENIIPVELPLDILYEDEDLLVVNKPAGMPIHPSQNNRDNSLGNALAWYFSQRGEPFVFRCINRLDRDTSGLTIIARNIVSAGILSAQISAKPAFSNMPGTPISGAPATTLSLCGDGLSAGDLPSEVWSASTLSASALSTGALSADALSASALSANALSADALSADALSASALSANALSANHESEELSVVLTHAQKRSTNPQELSSTHGILREYLAIVKGSVTPPSGTITAPLGRKEGSIIERTVDFENGEHAVTHYRTLYEKNGHSLLSIILETGRTHQIRVHMKYLGFPLIGDYLYNPDMTRMSRQALHAAKLQFTHPLSGKLLEFTAPLPEDMKWMKP